MVKVFKGYNGEVILDEGNVTIRRSGVIAKASGQRSDYSVPTAAIRDIFIKKASAIMNGWIQIVVGDEDTKPVGSTEAVSHPGTVMFRRKDNDRFQALADELQSLVSRNREAGIDPASLGVVSPQQAKTNERQDKWKEKLGVGAREDIVQAASRMGWTLGGRKELRNLGSYLYDNETVEFIAQGTYEDRQGIVVLTSRRLLFLFHGIAGQTMEDFPLEKISSVSTKAGITMGEVKVHASGNDAIIKNIVKQDAKLLAEAVRNRTSGGTVSASSSGQDVLEQLRKLGELRDAGVLGDEEFESKKADLLRRL